MLLFLLLSFLATNVMHAYLLTSQTSSVKDTISHHAAATRLNHLIFIIGHLVGGVFFFIFAYDFFYRTHDATLLFWLAVAGVLFEQMQAIIPAKGSVEKLHTIAAGCMAASIAIIMVVAPFIIEIEESYTPFYWAGIVLLVAAGAKAVVTRNNFHRTQMLFFSMFYVLMVLLYISS